jgi:hypothetical protein
MDHDMMARQHGLSKLPRLASAFYCPFLLLLLTVLMFGDVLFSSQRIILSAQGTDLSLYFLYARKFAFDQIRQGNFPLWNPHLFSGTPFFGSLQSALFYPINIIYLLLPLEKAVNLEIALHVFLTGLWMYYWTLRRSLHPLACLIAATLWMFGAPYFLKIHAGHLAPLAAMCWIPLILLSLDELFERRLAAGCFLGVFSVTMQVLAGHPQTAYNTVIAVALYGGLRLIRHPRRLPVAAGVLAMYAGAVMICAAQLIAGWDAASESARSGGGVPVKFASMFSMPPENILTLLAPAFLGDMVHVKYWGSAYLWETSLYMGVAGFLLAFYGIAQNGRGTRRYWIPILVLIVLALGAYTPLFQVFYDFLPGFNKFRGHSKFIIPVSAFLAMLAAIGMNELLSADACARSTLGRLNWAVTGSLIFAGTGLGAGLWLRVAGPVNVGFWRYLLVSIKASHNSYISAAAFTSPEFINATGIFASNTFLVSGGLCLLLAALCFARRFSIYPAHFIAFIAFVEIFSFARMNRPSFPIELGWPRDLQRFLAPQPAAYRFLKTSTGNAAMVINAYDIWGYDPIVLGRYLQFMARTQGFNPSEANAAEVQFKGYHRLYAMLRCRYIYNPVVGKQRFGEIPGTLPHVLLVDGYSVMPDRAEVFKAMNRSDFDPRRRVMLETQPQPQPQKGATGSARVISEGTDFLIIEAHTSRPSILLVTDSYSKDWKAWGLSGSVQQEYSVLPANYVLRAIPLQAGHHLIRLEFLPRGLPLGKWISLLAVICYLGLLGGLVWSRNHTMPSFSR